jgi:uncharacterized protein involved in exopolysaccharide biosynthesis
MLTKPFPQLSARELIAFYYKHKKIIWLAFAVPFALSVLLSFVPTPKYKAYGVLTVRLGSEFVYQPETSSSPNNQAPSIPFEQDQIFKAEVAILNSDDLHAQVIRDIGANVLYPGVPAETASDFARVVQRFNSRFGVDLEKESSVITVSFEHKDGALAVKVLDTLLRLYMEKRKSLYLEPRVELAKTHAADAHERAIAAGKALEDYKVQHGIHALDLERSVLLQQQSDTQRELMSIKSPALNSRLASINKRLDEMNRVENDLNVLQRDATVAEDEYAVFAHRLSEAISYEGLERQRAGSVRVIQPPSATADPKSLAPFIIIGGFLFSVFCALAVAIFMDLVASGFSTPEQAEQGIGLPVLATVSLRR